jgi:hypothetical protein
LHWPLDRPSPALPVPSAPVQVALGPAPPFILGNLPRLPREHRPLVVIRVSDSCSGRNRMNVASFCVLNFVYVTLHHFCRHRQGHGLYRLLYHMSIYRVLHKRHQRLRYEHARAPRRHGLTAKFAAALSNPRPACAISIRLHRLQRGHGLCTPGPALIASRKRQLLMHSCS